MAVNSYRKDEEHIEKMSYEKDEKSKFLSGVGKYDEKLISLLDINSVLAENES